MKETVFQQPLPQVGTELLIGSQTIRLGHEVARTPIAAIYEGENTSTSTHYTLKIAIPAADAAWDNERRLTLKKEADVMRLLNRLEQVPNEGHRHIPLVDSADTATIPSDTPQTPFAILLMELTKGENGETLLYTGEGLGEEVGLRMGSQLADVVALAHLGNFQCGDLPPARLHWDTRHLMVTDWQQAQDMTSLPDAEKVTGKHQDTHTLATTICWLITGQPVPANGSLEILQERLSPPLATLLARAIHIPASFGTNPVPPFKADLDRLLVYWQEKDSYARLEQDIQEVKQEIAFLAQSTSPRSATAKGELVQRIDYLYEQLAIGKVRQPKKPWQHLAAALNELWQGQLALVLGEIEAGNMDRALDLLHGMHAYPQTIHRQVLWRQRVAEACLADPRLAKEKQRAVQAITEWDNGTYNTTAWLNFDQKHMVEKLSQPAREAIQRLQAELWIVALEDQYHQTPADYLEDRLTIISKLEKSVPDGIDAHLLDVRQHLCGERLRIEREREHIARVARMRQALSTLENRVQKQDATLTISTFDEVLADCTSNDDRRVVYGLRRLWQRTGELHQWIEDGDIPGALRYLATMGSMPDILHARLQRQIVHKLLQIAGEQPGKEASYAEAFDRLLQRPVQTPGDMEDMLLYMGYLLPVIDAPRRKAYDELVGRKERILKNLALLSTGEESLDTRIRAFHDLRSLGVHFLDDRILADSYGSYAIVQQQDQLGQLEAVAEQMQASIQSLRMYESMAAELQNDIQALRDRMHPMPARLLEREVAEIEQLMPSKEAQHRHHDLWESTTGLAKTFQTIANQRDYFHVSGLVEVFRQRCSDTIQDVVLEYHQQELESLGDLAREIYTLHIRLAYVDYTNEIGDFIQEQRERLNDQITRLLAYNVRKEDNETLALRIVAARRLLTIADALQGGVDKGDDLAWDDQHMQDEIIATYLRHRNQTIRRMMLRQLSPVVDVPAVSMALAQPLPTQRMPLRAYAITGVLVLVIIGLLFVMVQGILGGNTMGIAATPQPAIVTTTTLPTEIVDGSPTAAMSDSATLDTIASPTSGASFIPLDSLAVTTKPTETRQPAVTMRSSTGTIELYQGESASMRLTLEDANTTGATVQLVWDDVPEGITIDGDQQVALKDTGAGTVVELELTVAKDADPVAKTVRFTAVTSDAMSTNLADAQVYVIVNEYPPLMHTAMDVQDVLHQMLAITVTQNVAFRSEPIQSPTTQIAVLPPDTPLTILSLDTQSGYLHVRQTTDDTVIDGWVSTQDSFTTFDAATITLDQYPLRVILGSALNAGNQAALYTTAARDEAGKELVDAQEAELLDIVPVFEPQDEEYQLWVHVRLLDEDNPLEGWVLADDTNYEEVVTTIAAELELPL